MNSKKSNKNKITEIVQYLVAVAILLIIVFLVVTVYKVMTDNQAENNQSRTNLSYVANKIHGCDETGNVEIVDGKYGDTLVLVDKTDAGNFETRIYNYNGSMYEEYSSQDSEMDYGKAMEIAKNGTFELSYSDNLIKVETDQGQLLVALRTEE